MRTGLVARKLGMSRVYKEDGTHIPVTVLRMEEAQVIAHRTQEKHGYNAVVVGLENAKPKKVKKPQKGEFAKVKLEPKKKVVEFRVSDDALVDVGANLSVTHFIAGQKVDVSGISIGKGFAGGMKRHNFSGLEATHGVSISHRSHGSTGQCQEPGRVFKGKKMAGQLGNKKATVQNLEIVETDTDESLIVIKGAVPGAKGSFVTVRDAAKHGLPEAAPYPAGRKRLEEEVKAAEAEAIKQKEEEERAAAEARAAELKAAEEKAREEVASDKEEGGAAEAKEAKADDAGTKEEQAAGAAAKEEKSDES